MQVHYAGGPLSRLRVVTGAIIFQGANFESIAVSLGGLRLVRRRQKFNARRRHRRHRCAPERDRRQGWLADGLASAEKSAEHLRSAGSAGFKIDCL